MPAHVGLHAAVYNTAQPTPWLSYLPQLLASLVGLAGILGGFAKPFAISERLGCIRVRLDSCQRQRRPLVSLATPSKSGEVDTSNAQLEMGAVSNVENPMRITSPSTHSVSASSRRVYVQSAAISMADEDLLSAAPRTAASRALSGHPLDVGLTHFDASLSSHRVKQLQQSSGSSAEELSSPSSSVVSIRKQRTLLSSDLPLAASGVQ